MSPLYPAVTGVLVLLSHLFGLELYFGALNVVLASLSLFVCTSARPIFTFVSSFVFLVSVKNSPSIPASSDYLLALPGVAVVFAAGALFLSAVIYFTVKNKLWRAVTEKGIGTPLLLPLAVLSLGFAMNGAFSGEWSFGSLIFGLCEALCFFLLFMLLYLGIGEDSRDDIISSFVYSSAVGAAVLIAELSACYFTVFDGTKESVLLGWGIWNTAGVALAVLIPVCFLGFYRKSREGKTLHAWLYFALGVITFASAVLSQSRNALLVGALALFAVFVIFTFIGRYKTLFRIVIGAGLFTAVLGSALFFDKLVPVARGFLYDNGRFELWRSGIRNFLEAPIFGKGFFGIKFAEETFVTADFLPTMAHNTVVQLLAGMGVFGFLCYAFYRGSTVIPFVKHPTADKTFIGISVLVLLLESLLDNFIFYFLPTLQYTVALAVVFAVFDREREEEKNGKTNETPDMGDEIQEPETAL